MTEMFIPHGLEFTLAPPDFDQFVFAQDHADSGAVHGLIPFAFRLQGIDGIPDEVRKKATAAMVLYFARAIYENFCSRGPGMAVTSSGNSPEMVSGIARSKIDEAIEAAKKIRCPTCGFVGGVVPPTSEPHSELDPCPVGTILGNFCEMIPLSID